MSWAYSIPEELFEILQAIRTAGGHGVLVGGWVRDTFLKLPHQDFDVEVYRMDPLTLEYLLKGHGCRVESVGQSFGIFKVRTIKGQEFDFSLPRRENKEGQGHRGFQVQLDPSMTIIDAARRRDFTINSMAYDPLTNQVFDYFNGLSDLHCGFLRATSHHFSEDPLRVLRGMQFAGRFKLISQPWTINMSREMGDEYDTLSPERIWMEWKKWASQSRVPGCGLKFLQDTGWLGRFYPALFQMIGIPQDPVWHPEGDAWNHTQIVVNEAALNATLNGLSESSRLVLVLAALVHDLGKVKTTQFIDGRYRSRGHNTELEAARTFLESIRTPLHIQNAVLALAKNHMIHVNPITKRTVCRLALELGEAGTDIETLVLLIQADVSGRGISAERKECLIKLQTLAAELKLEKKSPQALVLGRHLIEHFGMMPGKNFGPILEDVFQAQLDGVFEDLSGGLEWLKQNNLKH